MTSDPVEPKPCTALVESYQYNSPLPKGFVAKANDEDQEDEYWMMGIDEAGRGPVLGPMVYGAAYCPMSFKDTLQGLGFDDSKALTHETRDALWANFSKYPELCYSTGVIAPQDISKDMLKKIPFNLNRQAEESTIGLIRHTLARGVRLKEVYVDALGDTTKWKAALSGLFPQIEFTVEKKADATYKIVGAASIAAKVTRDRLVEFWLHPEGSTLPACCKRPAHAGGSSSMAAKKRKKAICSASGSKKAKVEEEAAEEAAVEREREDDEEVAMIAEEIEERGSGYPGDPKTVAYLKAALNPIFGYPSIARFSWSGVKIVLDRECKACRWIDDDEGPKKKGGLKSMLSSTSTSSSPSFWSSGKESKIASEIGLRGIGEL